MQSVYSVDPVTGGPMRDRQNPFENMSNEEIEAEAEKLGDLIDQLNRSDSTYYCHCSLCLLPRKEDL